jgi:hypothetical protein
MLVKIVEVDASEASLFWQNSRNTNIFLNPEVLSKLSNRTRWFALIKGDHIKCIWPLCWNDSGVIEPPPFTYWVGPFWSESRKLVAKHSHLSEELDVFETYIRFFEEMNFLVNFELSTLDHDVRVFDWWNFNNDRESYFQISPRYTAQIDLERFSISDFRRNRKRQLRDFDEVKFEVLNDAPNIRDLIHLYNLEIGADISESVRRGIVSLVELVESGFGNLISVYSKETHSLCGFSLSLATSNQSNHVLNLTDASSKRAGLHAWLTYSAMGSARASGCKIFDFNGANSPMRGDDKHSYGSSYRLYFALKQHKFLSGKSRNESVE